jgi:hypothetical protein
MGPRATQSLVVRSARIEGMSEMLILIQAPIAADIEEMEEYQTEAIKRLKTLKGFRGASMWLQADDPSRMLQVYEYADLDSAEAGLKRIVSADLPVRSRSLMTGPADVMRMRVLGWHGTAVETSPIGTLLSISVRLGEPGLGDDINRDLETVFEELKVIDGYIGAIRGCNDVLEEEIVGIALWDNTEAFDRSLPKKAMYHVKLYRKVV